ncbi:VWA domain-containing protein [Desulfopila sp. IMCC35006]|uniref:VWA domain-containing protein n=1 Tax=Desulfopila sp. IMCC35006 TaxID=2569542 RepID=UPI0010ACF601|nr:VWA domain-containing protein [Desulfopila sp. IMCC35006]TKB26577.1 VWA domain-containing protein [Desulfopila sp. IMCC35006]
MKDKEITSRENEPAALGKRSSSREIAAFLKAADKVDMAHSGKLIFSLDATISRQPTWTRAMTIQSSMFDAVGKTGGLSVQLVYYRGFDECRASKWVINAAALRGLMQGIQCRGGQTQIAKVLNHANQEATKAKVSALIFIGDAMEESIDYLCQLAGELGLKGVRCFFFQEGNDETAERGFREMARLTGGAYFRLGPDSAKELAELLGAVAIYARGGIKALSNSGRREAHLLLDQIKK